MSIALLCSSAAALGGCRPSDVLKEMIYDQTASTVDYDNPTKFFISDSTSDIESDSVSSKETNTEDSANKKTVQNLVIYGSDPNIDRYKAKKSAFSAAPEFRGIEASEGVKFYKSKDKNATEHKFPDEEKEQKNQKKNEQTTEVGGGSGDGSNSSGDKADNKSKNVKAKDAGDDGAGSGGEVTVTDTTGKYSDPPKVDRIAAYGQAAVIVQMVGGEKALAASDKELLSSDFSKVFKDEGASSIAEGWGDSGETSEDMDVDAIIKAKVDTVLAYSSKYLSSLSSKDKKKLNDAGITVTVIPRLNNSTGIKQAVSVVGEMLSEATDIGNAGKTEEIASDYEKFHDDLIDDCVDANGGKYAGTRAYETKSTGKKSFNSSASYTLLVDDYDESAKFKGTAAGWTPVNDGVAIATIGWSTRPTSYYIQAGGLINTAASQYTETSLGSTVVWQFNTNQLSYDKSNWTYSKTGSFASLDPNNLDANKGQGWGTTLLCVANTDNTGAGDGMLTAFGNEDFPKIIVTKSSMKSKIISNSKNSNGIYHPYNLVTASGSGLSTSAFGKLSKQTIIYSSIGVDSSKEENLFGSSIPSDAIVVNPHGLFSDWTEGGVESVLEAAWVNDEVNEDSTKKVDVEKYVSDFYSEFYRYDLGSDVSKVLGGE